MNTHSFAAAGLLAAALLATSSSAHSHHSFFAYDDSRLVDVQGEVTSIVWQNPHIRFTVSSTSDTGEEVLWEIEGDSVNTMERNGFNADTIGISDNVQLRGLATTRDENLMRPVYITLPNGQSLVLDKNIAATFGLSVETVELASPGIDAETIENAVREASGIFRVWTNRGWSQASRPWSEGVRPLQSAARAARDAWDQTTDDLAGRCIPAGMPEAQMNPFPIQFSEQDGDIHLRIEEWDNTRTIHMGDSGNAMGQPSSPLGYSVGRWEGNTLVVETSKINYPFFDDRGTPQSDAVEIIERFTLSEDETRLDRESIVIDPATFTEPVVMPDLHWEWVPGEELRTYNCTVSE